MATLGEARVRLSFNPSANLDVEDIKRRSADCIDWCEAHKIDPTITPPTTGSLEINRWLALAQTHYETAAMYAVKAATAELAPPIQPPTEQATDEPSQ